MESTVLEAILQGWKLFPARWDAEEKRHHGYIKWGEGSSNDPEVIKGWLNTWPSCHLCINLEASGLNVIDVDNKKGRSGSDTLGKLVAEHGSLPSTLVVETPSGGYHYYYTGNARNCIGEAGLGSGLDLPVMVPLAGQTVVGKGTYKILEPNFFVSSIPEWIPEMVGRRGDKKEKKPDPGVTLNLPDNIIKATLMAQNAEPAPEGERNARIYALACAIRDLAIDENYCENILLQVNSKICTPALSEREVSATVIHAYEYAKDVPGNSTAAADFTDDYVADEALAQSCPEPVVPKGVFRLTDFSGPAPERNWIVPDWLPESELVALYGPPGSGKSLIALQLSLSIASGSKWLGMETKRMPVLLVACEDNADELHRRVDAVKRDPAHSFIFDDDKIVENWFGWPRVGNDNALARSEMSSNRLVYGEFWKELQAQVHLMPEGKKLIILDTIADIFAGNENDRSAVNSFLKTVLGKLRVNHDATVLIVGHPAKSTDSQYSGSTAWDGGVRSRWYMSQYDRDKPGLQNYRLLERAKANYSAINGNDTKLVLQWMNGSFIPVVESEIIDDDIENDCRLLYDIISEEADTGVRLNTHGSAAKYIYKWPKLKRELGSRMTKPHIDACLAKLMSDGLIEKSRSQSSSGYAPTYVGLTEEGVRRKPEDDMRRIDEAIRGDHENSGE